MGPYSGSKVVLVYGACWTPPGLLLVTDPFCVTSGLHLCISLVLMMFPSSTTHDSNDQLVIKLCSGPIRSNSFESGVVEEGNIENMQGSGS